MTGTTQMLMGGVYGPSMVLADTRAGATSSASFVLFTDGSITSLSGSGSSVNPAAWYLPITAGISTGKWARLHVNSGTNPSAGLVDTMVDLSPAGGKGWQWQQAAVGTQSANATVTCYADSGGTNIVSQWTFPVSLNRTS